MKSLRTIIFTGLIAVVLLVSGCADFINKLYKSGDQISSNTQALFYGDDASTRTAAGDMSPGDVALAKGVMAYDDANYPVAANYLNQAIELHPGTKASQIKAHKYLAFIHCISSRENLCRSEFRKVLELDPDYVLEPAEKGHPIWGPIFRSVKAEMGPANKQ